MKLKESTIAHCLGALTQDGKNALNHDFKHNNGRNFQLIKFSFIDFSSPKEEVFQENGQSRPAANLPVVDFRSQPRERPLPKPLDM